MLLYFCLRNVRRNLSRYLLAAGGICLTVFLVAATLTGVTALRRVGAQPAREFIGGDVMVFAGTLVSEVQSEGLFLEFDGLRAFPAEALSAALSEAGLSATRTVFVPMYVYMGYGGEEASLIARDVATPGPTPPTLEGRFLGPEDAGRPSLVIEEGSSGWGPTGKVTARVARYSVASASGSAAWDLAGGQDVTFEVVGTYGRPALNGWGAFAPLDYVAGVTDCRDALWVGVEVADYSRLAAVADRIRQLAPGYTVLTAPDLLGLLDAESANLQKAALPIILLVLGVGCLSVLNTALLLARLRRQETALMKVMGFGPWSIGVAFVLDSLTANLLGAAVGYLAGSFVGSSFGAFGLGLSMVSLSYVVGLAGVVTLAAALLPAVWVTRYSALEVMRNA